MAHKVAVVPVFGVDPPSELFAQCERCFRAFTVARMDKPWMNSVEWNILVESDNLVPDPKFHPLVEFAKYEEKFERIAAAGNSSQKLKKIIRHALTLQWNSTDILSPVKRRPSMNRNGFSMRAKVIVLAGTLSKDDYDAKLITDSILKWAANTEIRIVHLAKEKVFTNIEYLDSNQEITRFSDLLGTGLTEMIYERRILATPEGVTETALQFKENQYKIKVTAREKIKLVEIRAELSSNAFVQILSQLLGERPFQGTCSANANKELLPLVGKMFIVRLNENTVAIASVTRPIASKIVFQFRKTKENFKLPVSNCRMTTESSYPGHIISAPSRATVDMTRFDFSYVKTAADNSGKGLSLLQKKIENMTKLTKKEGVDHDNILPRKLRVRATPTKTPMKSTPTSSVGSTPRRNSSARHGGTPQTPQNENRELKRLCRYFPDSISALEEHIKNAMKYSCYATVCKLCTNFLAKNAQIGLKELRKTKDEIFDGVNENLTRLCKLQFLFYFLDKKTDEGELRELGTLMRWFTFSSSPADLNLFFEETIIPVWIEKNDQEMIQKLLDVYNDLMLSVPKALIKFLPANSDSDASSSGEDNDDVITVEPSSVSTSSVISSSMSLFSNASKAADTSTQLYSRKLSSSNQSRMIQIRNMSEPNRKNHRRESKTRKDPSPLANKLGPRKSDRAKRALFMASPDPQKPVQSQNSSRVQSQSKPISSPSSNVHRTPGKSLPKPKVLITKSAKDTPLKAQELGTRSSRSKFRSLRRQRKRKNSTSEIDLVEESPMKAINYTPKAGPIRKLLKEDDHQMNSSALNSTADLLSPRDNQLARSLLFGASSEASSSDDEVISSRSAVTERMSPAKFSFTSPIRAGNENELLSPSKLSHRRRLTTDVGPSPLSKNDDLLNKSFDNLKTGQLVGQRSGLQDARMKKFPGVSKARRQLRLSESEK